METSVLAKSFWMSWDLVGKVDTLLPITSGASWLGKFFQPDADAARIYSADEKYTEVFSSEKEHWQLPAAVQADLDVERKADADKDKVQQLTRKMFTDELHRRLTASGFDITVSAREENTQELVLDSEIFKHTGARVEFLRGVLPDWRGN